MLALMGENVGAKLPLFGMAASPAPYFKVHKAMALTRRPAVLLLCLVLLLSGGCVEYVRRPAVGVEYTQLQAGDDANATKWVAKNCPFGKPQLVGSDSGPTELVYREGYVLQHSGRDKIPLWVCEGLYPGQLTGPGDRKKSSFKADPDLKGPRGEPSDYKLSGYDQGHNAPAADFKRTQKMMNESHYMSNMAPQVGQGFNQTVWRKLEDRVRTWVTSGTVDQPQVWVTTGTLFYDPKEENPMTATGWVEHKRIGLGRVSVPTHFYKIVVGRTAEGQWHCVAFVMENKKYPNSYDPAKSITTVKWIEDHTRINFMPELDAQPQLRQQLERTAGTMWN